MTKELATVKKGGSFLIEETAAPDIFTPEDLTEEQTMIRDMTEQFVEDEVLPQVEKIEHQQWDVTVALLRRCGETCPRRFFCRLLWRSQRHRYFADCLFRQRRTQTKVSTVVV